MQEPRKFTIAGEKVLLENWSLRSGVDETRDFTIKCGDDKLIGILLPRLEAAKGEFYFNRDLQGGLHTKFDGRNAPTDTKKFSRFPTFDDAVEVLEQLKQDASVLVALHAKNAKQKNVSKKSFAERTGHRDFKITGH